MNKIEKDTDSIVTKLQKIPLFSKIKEDKNELGKIADILEPKFCERNGLIIKEGDFGSEMYILKSGVVEITKSTLEDEEYTLVKLNSDMNVFFGELALLDNDKRSASIKAVTNCEYWALSRENFEKLGENEPSLCLLLTREIAQILASRLRKSNLDMIILFESLVNEVEETLL